MLLCFGTTKRVARRSYLGAIRAGREAGAEDGERAWHPFVNDPELELTSKGVQVDQLGRSMAFDRPRLDAERFVALVCKTGEFDRERFASTTRHRGIAEARRLIATLGAERWEQNRHALAQVLNKNPDVVSWWVGEGSRRRAEDLDCAARLDHLDRRLSETVINRGRGDKGVGAIS